MRCWRRTWPSIASLEARVNQSRQTLSMTDAQTDAALKQVAAMETSMRSQLDQARANLELASINYKRTLGLFDAGVLPAQSRDQDAAALKASQANVKSLEDQVRAQGAALAVARANRQQVQVQQADLLSAQAQLNQAKAARDQVQTQLGYTKIFAPLDGIVSVRVAKQGEMVAQGGPIVVLVDTNDLWVRADVEETYIDSIHFRRQAEGSIAFRRCAGGERDFQGRGRRLCDATGREPHEAGHQNFCGEGGVAESEAEFVHGYDCDGAVAAACREAALVWELAELRDSSSRKEAPGESTAKPQIPRPKNGLGMTARAQLAELVVLLDR